MAVSIVMTVYNGERFLAESLESILNQSMTQFELIVVDDGSTDSSGTILEIFARRDERMKILRQHQAGVGAAANRGIRHARYDRIARMDCDDRMLAQRLQRQVSFLNENPKVDVLCSNCYFINAAGKRIGSSYCRVDVARAKAELRPAHCLELIQSTVMMRKEVFVKVGGYREDLAYAEDRDLWGRIATNGFAIAVQTEPLVEYRLHAGSMTMKKAALQQEICGYIDENVNRRFQGKPEISLGAFQAAKRRKHSTLRLWETARFMALHAFKRASRHYGERQYWKCAVCLAAAVSLNPAHIIGRLLKRIQIREAGI